MTEQRSASLDALLARLAQGDRSALGPVYELLWPSLVRWAQRWLAPAEAEDAAQETLAKLFFRAAVYDPERDAERWVFGILSYEILTQRKRAARRREHSATPKGPDDARSPEADLLDAERDQLFGRLIAGLGPLDEATLRTAAAGRHGDVPAATFRKRLQRAVARARRAWRVIDGSD